MVRRHLPPPPSGASSSSMADQNLQRWGSYARRGRPPVDLNRQAQDTKLALGKYTAELDDAPVIAPKTLYKREYIMREWVEFWRANHETMSLDPDWMDPDEIWYGLCRQNLQAQRLCKVFWRGFLSNSRGWFPVLDLGHPETEYEERMTITSAISLLTHWRSLISHAHNTVLARKRKEESRIPGGNPRLYHLTFNVMARQAGIGPTYEIAKYLVHDLALEFGLSQRIMVEKNEATAKDVVLIADTVLERPDDVPCDPNRRIDFLADLYRQVKLFYVRDPRDRSRVRLVAVVELIRNKQRRQALLPAKPQSIRFAVTLIPYKSLCLTSMIVSRAIQHDAFQDVTFDSADDIFQQPLLENSDCIPIPWKTEMLEKPLFDLSYEAYNDLWRRVCLVAGIRKDERLYALRVGAAARLDGSLTDCLRNYVLDQSTAVFQSSYQAHTVRKSLTALAFGRQMGGDDDALVDVLRSLSLSRDTGAPIYVSEEYETLIESRSDVRSLRNDRQQAKIKGDKKEAERLRSALTDLKENLQRLALTQQREKYFHEADACRLNGEPTADLASRQPLRPIKWRVRKAPVGEADMARFTRYIREAFATNPADFEAYPERNDPAYIDLLLQYRTGKPGAAWQPPHDTRQQDDTASPPGPVTSSAGRPKCLICQDDLHNRSGLTRHYVAKHVKMGHFDHRFSCPECSRQGMPDMWIENGKSEWAAHVERVHGRLHTPSFAVTRNGRSETGLPCFACPKTFTETRYLVKHYKITHDKKEGLFDQPYVCPNCQPTLAVKGIDEWLEHIRAYHGESIHGTVPLRCMPTLDLKRKAPDGCPATGGLDEPGSSRRHSGSGSDRDDHRRLKRGDGAVAGKRPRGASSASYSSRSDLDAVFPIDPILLEHDEPAHQDKRTS